MIRKLGILAALMGSAAQNALAQQSAYPLDAVLDRARAACEKPAALSTMEAGLRANGWKPHEVDPTTPLGKYIAGATQGGGAMNVSYRTFRVTVEGRELTAFVAQLDLNIMDKRSTAVSCEIFDPTASGPLSQKDVRRWAGRKPTSSRSANGMILERWIPGLTRGSDETEIILIPAAHALAQTRAGLTYSVTRKLGAKEQ